MFTYDHIYGEQVVTKKILTQFYNRMLLTFDMIPIEFLPGDFVFILGHDKIPNGHTHL